MSGEAFKVPHAPLTLYQWFLDCVYQAARQLDSAPADSSALPVRLRRAAFIQVYRLYHAFREIYTGRGVLEMQCSSVADILRQKIGADAFEDADLLANSTHKKVRALDRGPSIQHAEETYAIECALAALTATQEQYHLLLRAAEDQESTDAQAELIKKIFYRAYYKASSKHGKTHLDLLTYNIDIIYSTHAAVQQVLDLADKSTTWEKCSDDYNKLAGDLSLDFDAGQKGKHWGQLGFQGKDPSTDFRASGLLGLRHLRHLAANHAMYAHRMLAESSTVEAARSPDIPWYPFALCSIHVTNMLLTLLRTGALQRQLIRAAIRSGGGEDAVEGVLAFTDELHSYFLCRCHLDWATGVDKEEITTVLQFEDFFKEYAAYELEQLHRTQFQVEDLHVSQCKWW
ncbi:ELMO domain-containing protein 3 [Savitreella phatthalungensis]